MRVSIIVAIAENGVIGRGGGLPWRLSEDLKRFKELTMGKPIVMGRKTFQSIGKPLPGRPNIVITRDKSFHPEGVHVAHGFEEALETAAELGTGGNEDEIMIIGGAEIYRLALAVAERMYLTKVHDTPKGDAYFPDYDRARWREVSRDSRSGRPAYDFVVLERVRGAINENQEMHGEAAP